ncbi:MAG: PQQ-binding-like beta-propeller repeat protein [Terricaulis sp.]
MSRLGPIAAALAAAAALSACSTVSRVGDMFGGGNDEPTQTAPEDGRISILTFEQALTPDPALAGRTVVVPPPAAAGDWSQPGGTIDNTPVHVAGTAGLQVAWRANLGAGSDRRVRLAAPPVISEGKLFFLDADHRVHAVDANTGDRLWTHELRPNEGEDRRARGGGVAASAGRVFVTTGFGFAVALNAQDGSEVWRAQAGAPFHAAPTVAGGRVYAVTNDSELVALNAGTGEVQWTYQAIAEPARILSASSPAVEGDTVIAPFASGEMIALISANGRRLWVDSLSRTGRLTSLSSINDIAGRPAIDNGVAYAASHSGLLAAVDVRSGTRIWSRAFASTQTPWIAGDVLYAVNIDGELVALDKTTGGVFWVRQLRRFEDEEDHEGRISWTGPILVGGKLVLANSLGEVVAVTPETGEVATHRRSRQAHLHPADRRQWLDLSGDG